MKKRVISTLLCATMLVGMITGCGSNNTESAGNTSSNAASTESGDGEKVGPECDQLSCRNRLCGRLLFVSV